MTVATVIHSLHSPPRLSLYLNTIIEPCFFVSAAAVYIAQIYNPGLTEEQSLRLELSADLAFVLPVILASGVSVIWENRKEKKAMSTTMLKSTIV